jgi:hypothetical protein
MSAASLAAREKATISSVQLDGEHRVEGRSPDRPVGRHFRTATSVMRAMFPRKSAYEVASRAGVQVRAAERWLAGTREMGAEQLLTFIASDKGAEFIELLINGLPRNKRVIFWARLERAAKRALKEERIRKLQDEIEQLRLPE